MKHLFVSYELAFALKLKGFDENCFAYYTPAKQWMKDSVGWSKTLVNGFLLKTITDPFGDNLYRRDEFVKNSKFTKAIHNFAVPLYQQVVDWFRESHDIDIYLIPQDNGYMPYLSTTKVKHSHVLPIILDISYYQALDKAIEEALKLI